MTLALPTTIGASTRSPSPQPSPAGRGSQFIRVRADAAHRLHEGGRSILPLPAGEGRGEGERPRRTQNFQFNSAPFPVTIPSL